MIHRHFDTGDQGVTRDPFNIDGSLIDEPGCGDAESTSGCENQCIGEQSGDISVIAL